MGVMSWIVLILFLLSSLFAILTGVAKAMNRDDNKLYSMNVVLGVSAALSLVSGGWLVYNHGNTVYVRDHSIEAPGPTANRDVRS